MTITKTQEGSSVILKIAGRIDTETAPELEETVNGLVGQADAVTFDLEGTEYISSSGIRALMSARRRFPGADSMKVIHANEIVKEVLNVTGLTEALNIQ